MPKETFLRIEAAKQEKILETAANEFAQHGYHKANINHIAAKAGISIGAMYKYFENKEDLAGATLLNGISVINHLYSAIEEIDDSFEQIRSIFTNTISLAEKYSDYLKLYLLLFTSDMDEFAEKYAQDIEDVGSNYLKKIIKDGIQKGYIDPNTDVNETVLFLDNHLMMFTFSQVSVYLKLRQETFLEEPMDMHHYVDETVHLCRKMFENKQPSNG